MKRLVVSSLTDARSKFVQARCTHAISFRGNAKFPELDDVIPSENWLRLTMEDRYSDPGTAEYNHARRIVNQLLAFARALPDDAVVGSNCLAGISRSTAAGLIVAVARHGFEAGTALYDKAVTMAAPNETLIHIADLELGLNGALLEWVEESVSRYYTKRGILVPTGLLRVANKTEKDLISDGEHVDALLKEFGLDVDKDA